MGVGEFVSSPVFRVGGYDWDIKFYPAGQSSTCAGFASCFLRCLNEATDVRTEFKLRMMETKGQEEVASFGVERHNFASGKADWGFEKFVDRSKLESLSCLGDRGFTIRCVLAVRKEFPPPELPGQLERILRDGTGADVIFMVGGREYRAHRCLLAARSPVFCRELFGDPVEKNMPCVEVGNVDPFIFEMMLHYIYTDSLPPSNDDEAGGYRAATSAGRGEHVWVG
jgi:speckle-type POZ protein